MPGFIFYRGPSLIDSKPIIGVAIIKSGNTKTGDMIQTYIMPDGISPLDASKSGADYSVCGDCKHRGKPTNDPTKKQATERSCYVNLGQGPTMVYKALQRGVYPVTDVATMQYMLKGKMLRMGTWGDPAAIPMEAWQPLLNAASGHTGYTHNLRVQPVMANLLMVSADTQQQGASAKAHGRRTFRVIPVAAWESRGRGSLMKHEILCPASAEAGYRTTCDSCLLCGGKTTRTDKSIAIVAHGVSRRYVA